MLVSPLDLRCCRSGTARARRAGLKAEPGAGSAGRGAAGAALINGSRLMPWRSSQKRCRTTGI